MNCVRKKSFEKWNVKEHPRFFKTKFTEEFKDFVNNEVKGWKEEKEKDRISFKEIFKQQEMKSKVRMEKEVIKVLKTNENIVRDAAEKKKRM